MGSKLVARTLRCSVRVGSTLTRCWPNAWPRGRHVRPVWRASASAGLVVRSLAPAARRARRWRTRAGIDLRCLTELPGHFSDGGLSRGRRAPAGDLSLDRVAEPTEIVPPRSDESAEAKAAGLKAVGAGAGALVFARAGLAGGPVGVLIGAAIGSLVGGLAGSIGAEAGVEEEVREARQRVVTALGASARWFGDEVLTSRLQAAAARRARLTAWGLESRWSEEAPGLLLALDVVATAAERRLRATQRWLSARRDGDAHDQAHAGWAALEQAARSPHPDLEVQLLRVRGALHAYALAKGDPIDV